MTLNAPLRASVQCYAVIVRLYPATLQRQFGQEMLGVFEEQIQDAWMSRGFAGLARVWAYVLAEVFTERAPRLAVRILCGVPMLSMATASLLFVVFFWASGFARPCP